MPDKLTYSLLVPCYNASVYADQFIEQISQLSRSFDEILFYDDASSDNTSQILTAAGFNVIKGNINKGPGFARNRLAEMAAGQYIHFHDIDDEFNPLFLELVDKKLTGNNADVIVGRADWIDGATRETVIKWQYEQVGINADPVSYFITHPLGIINTVYKKDSFLKAGGFNEDIKCWEDADLHVRLANRGAVFAVINEVLAYSVRHNNGISQNQEWCWGCRLKFLEIYNKSLDAKYQSLIGAEFEKAANNLFYYGKFSKAVQAFRNSRKSGFNSPAANNPLLKNIKKISPLIAFFLKASLVRARQQ